jgi:hypothetical protein
LDLRYLIAQTKKQIEDDTKSSKDKLAFYLSAGIVKNTLGNLGKIDKLFDKEIIIILIIMKAMNIIQNILD